MSGNYRGTKPSIPRGKAMSAKHVKEGKKVKTELVKSKKVYLKALKQQLKADTEHEADHKESKVQDQKEIAQIIKSMRSDQKDLKGKYASSRRQYKIGS